MARIIVQADDSNAVVLDERHVQLVHLDSEQSAVHLLERLAWAIESAEKRPARQRRRRNRRGIQAVSSGVGRTFD